MLSSGAIRTRLDQINPGSLCNVVWLEQQSEFTVVQLYYININTSLLINHFTAGNTTSNQIDITEHGGRGDVAPGNVVKVQYADTVCGMEPWLIQHDTAHLLYVSPRVLALLILFSSSLLFWR